MKKDKKWTKVGRKFLNGAKHSDCFGAVTWRVDYTPARTRKLSSRNWLVECGEKEAGEEHSSPATFHASISVNEEGQYHSVFRKADLRPVRTLRAELDKFEDACLEAMQQAEESNAKEQD